jgi:hypothetical protein
MAMDTPTAAASDAILSDPELWRLTLRLENLYFIVVVRLA